MRSPEAVAAMPCPVDKTPLAMSDRHGIEIDYCPQCRGVWLDRGELDKIVERAGQAAPKSEDRRSDDRRASSQPWGGDDRRADRDRREDDDRRGGGRGSWLQNLFD